MKICNVVLVAVCLFHLGVECEASLWDCLIGNRSALDTHLAAYFSDPSATHVCGDISTWDVSKVTDFSELFKDQANFNADISNWDTSSATNLGSMFRNASNFDQNIPIT